MLWINRNPGEQIYIDTADGRLTLTVVEIRGQQVKIGFDPQKHAHVSRPEWLEKHPEFTAGEKR